MIEHLYTAPPAGSVVVCLDEMGPQASQSDPGQPLVRPAAPTAERARQDIDDGRRGVAGSIFGAFQPASGEALTRCYERRTATNWVDVLSAVEDWIDPAVERVSAVLDHLNSHNGPGVLLFSLLHPRWEFVFQPIDAADLNLIEPWWKVLKALALKGRRFEAWAEIEQAVERATASWNDHKHPFVWGRRRRHHPPRRLGIAALSNLTRIERMHHLAAARPHRGTISRPLWLMLELPPHPAPAGGRRAAGGDGVGTGSGLGTWSGSALS